MTLEVSEILGEPRDPVHTPNSKSPHEVWAGRRGPHFLGSILLRFLPADPLTSTNRALGGLKFADRLGLHGRFAPHRLSASLGRRGCKAEISLCLIPTWGQYEPKQWRAPKATASRCQQTLFNSYSTGGGSGGGDKDGGTRRTLATSASIRKCPPAQPSKRVCGARDGGGEAPACSEYEADPKGASSALGTHFEVAF